jgi:hypothetical protein
VHDRGRFIVDLAPGGPLPTLVTVAMQRSASPIRVVRQTVRCRFDGSTGRGAWSRYHRRGPAPKWRNGRRGGLKHRWGQPRQGSNPCFGTIGGRVDEFLSTKQLGWVLGRSASSIRSAIRSGELAATRIPGGFRIPREEVLRVSREHVEAEAGRKLDDRELERLIDEVLATNEDATGA